jgi:hypothetical protein
LTTPSIEPEFPNWAFARPAAKDNSNPKTKAALMLKHFNIFFHPFRVYLRFCVDTGRRKAGGSAANAAASGSRR